MRKRQRERSKNQTETSGRSFWSGTITFGLVSVPVELYPAVRSSHVSLRMLGPDGHPLNRRYYSSQTGHALDEKELASGYEIKKHKWIVVTDEELEKLAPEKSRDIDLKRFVDLGAIPPLYFEHSYLLAPASESAKAYHLLAAVMEKASQAGIATFVMRGKAYMVAIIAKGGVLMAETMRFSDEIRSPSSTGLPKLESPSKAAVAKYAQLIQRGTRKSLLHDRLRDQQAEQLERYAEKKGRSHPREIIKAEVPASKGAEVVDIMSVLKKSLQQTKRKAA